jgi:hypothetical protein
MNGPSNLWMLTHQFESGLLSERDFVRAVKINVKATYDYMRLIAKELPADSSLPMWYDVREVAERKLIENPHGIKD